MQFLALLTIAAILNFAGASPVAAPEALEVTLTKVNLSSARLAELEAATSASNSTLVDRATAASCTWTAYSGDSCNAAGGSAITIGSGGVCIGNPDRHSFFVSAGCPNLNNVFYSGGGCGGSAQGRVTGQGCYNVNTGGPWVSTYVSRA